MQARDKIDSKSYEYIHESIMKCGIDDLYLPILEDILVRRTYLYKLPFEKVQKDVKALQHWLKHIYMEEYTEEQRKFCRFLQNRF